MKKYLVAMAVALMVCMLGMTASAETAEVESYVEAYIEDCSISRTKEDAIVQAYTKVMNDMSSEDLDIKTRMKIMADAYEDAGWTVIQETSAIARSVDIAPDILQLAYSDFDKADLEMREKILDAREIVINNSSWHNDIEAPNAVSYMIDYINCEITFNPLYSELFPGWDPPQSVQIGESVMDVSDVGVMESVLKGAERILSSTLYYDGYCTVSAASSTPAPDFCSVPLEKNYQNIIETAAIRSYTNEMYHVNIGYNDPVTGKRVGTRTRVPLGLAYVIEKGPNSVYTRLNPCVSTYATPGGAYMKVRRSLN